GGRRAGGVSGPGPREIPGARSIAAAWPRGAQKNDQGVPGPGTPWSLAEGVGFEPTVPGGTHALQACLFGRSSTLPYVPMKEENVAEGVGFEPTRRVNRLTHFECAAFGRSATPPCPTQSHGPALLAQAPEKPLDDGPALFLQHTGGHRQAMVEARVLHQVP